MKNILFLLTLAALLISGCGRAATPFPTPTSLPPTSTVPVATAVPSAAATELPISAEASAYLEEALDIMQTNSLHRHTIDWETLRQKAFNMAKHAQTPADTYPAIRYALNMLGDRHSFFATPEVIAEWEGATVNDFPAPRGKLLLDKLGFIAIEGYGGVDPEQDSKYATLVQQLIRELDAQNPCGWIVDLRENTGGNMWPMLAGLGPLLGEGEAGAFVDPDGEKEIWSYRDGQALAGEFVQSEVNGPAYELKSASPPVAVLTGIQTASSGEAMVVSFRGRPDTRSFGLYTAGLSTGNAGFDLSDGAMIILTGVVFADRTGQTYGDRIHPDELVDVAWKLTTIMEEAIPQPAIDWLMSRPACA